MNICKIKRESDIEKENIFKLLIEKEKQKELEINELKTTLKVRSFEGPLEYLLD